MKAVTSARCSIGCCSLVSFLNTGEDQFHSSCLIAPWINPVCWHRMCLQLAWHQEGHPAGKSSTLAISKSFFKHIRGLLWLSCFENDRLIYWSLLDRYLSVDLTAHFNPHCTSPNLTVSCLTKIKSTMGFSFWHLGPDLLNILRQSYCLTIMPKFRSTYNRRLIHKTSYEWRKVFLRYNSLAKSSEIVLH